MSVINTNVSSLIAQNALRQNNASLQTSLERLSTGLRINTGADDPAGYIASQGLQQQETGLDTADQLQVDSILSTINRIAGSTTFDGTQLLNGNLDYTTSGVNSTQLQNVQINSALIPENASVNVAVEVTSSAKTAEVTSTQGTVSGGTVTLDIAGNVGSTQVSFASGTTTSAIAAAINEVTTQTGVSAAYSGTALKVNSSQYGSSQFASVQTVAGTYAFDETKANGKDADVTINGNEATVNGLQVNYRSSVLDLSLNLASAFDKPGSASFQITGGGAQFQLGATVNAINTASIGISDVSTANLGTASDGYLNSLGSGGTNSLTSGNLTVAQNILTDAINQVSELSGRLGAFQELTIGSTVNSLNVAYENAASAESAITDTDFAGETSNLTRAQILTQSATTVLAQANTAPQEALTLLRGGQ
jgi:flagellin